MNIRRKAFQLLLVLLIVASNFGLTRSTPVMAASQSWRLRGVMTMTVQIPSVYLSTMRIEKYTTNVEVVLSTPQQVGVHKEQNPFSMIIQSVPLLNNPGEVSISSSLAAEGVIFQYWTFASKRNRNGNLTFTGQLTNNHVQEALALNLITVPTEIAPNLWMPYTHAMANGTQLEGILTTDGQAQFVIQGNTTDSYHSFTLEITASLS